MDSREIRNAIDRLHGKRERQVKALAVTEAELVIFQRQLDLEVKEEAKRASGSSKP